jgi:hypothetical protein
MLQFALAVVHITLVMCAVLILIREFMEKGRLSKLTIVTLQLFAAYAIMNSIKEIL